MPFFNRWSRKLHRWGAILIALPLLLVIVSGLLLQVKKQWAWVQPPTLKGTQPGEPQVSWPMMLAALQTVPAAQVRTWADVERLDVQPGKSLVKVQAANHWEVQLDLATGQILSSNYRRSDWIESLHDGSFFGDWSKLTIFLGNGLILLFLWLSGLYLWWLPGMIRRRKRKAKCST